MRVRIHACVNVIPTNCLYSHDYKDIRNHLYYHKYPHNQYRYAVTLTPLISVYLIVLKLLSLSASFMYSLI